MNILSSLEVQAGELDTGMLKFIKIIFPGHEGSFRLA
jgi:hypothetical protein